MRAPGAIRSSSRATHGRGKAGGGTPCREGATSARGKGETC
jgi:hypothetical protein